jgi:predicted 2-oxoglutarate/Fe(II)-dependent dioxygenase YbiX
MPVYQQLWGVVMHAYGVLIDHFDRNLAWIEAAGIMRYPTGGFYRCHSDNSIWDSTTRSWVRSLDRDFSLLIYINEDFEGGAIYFNNFDLRIQPKAGMMIGFPSDYRYIHAAEEVTAGERYAIVSWSAADDVPKIRQRPSGSILIR